MWRINGRNDRIDSLSLLQFEPHRRVPQGFNSEGNERIQDLGFFLRQIKIGASRDSQDTTEFVPLVSEKTMKQSKDPFEAALEEQEESPPDSPIASHGTETKERDGLDIVMGLDDHQTGAGMSSFGDAKASTSIAVKSAAVGASGKNKEEDEDEEEENVDVELGKFPSSADATKMAKMQEILSKFTEDQMSRYESFRRSALQKSNMRRLLVSITGSQKISLPMTIVVCGITKMFVGELVETARVVMTERKDSGPIRPCHMRETYRRLKLEGKVPRKSALRLFR